MIPATPGAIRPGVDRPVQPAVPERVVPVEAQRPSRADIGSIAKATNDEQFNSAVQRAAERGVPLIITFTDTTSGISGPELQLLARAKQQHGQQAEVLLVDRATLARNSQLSRHFEDYVARNGYPVTMLARASENLRPSDLRAGSQQVADCRYGADVMMTAKLGALKTAPRHFDSNVRPAGALEPSRPPVEDQARPQSGPERSSERRPATTEVEQGTIRSFDVRSQADYRTVLQTAGENRQPVVALFYSSSSPISGRAAAEYSRAKERVGGATYMAFDVDQLDRMTPEEIRNSPIAAYADYVRRQLGYPTTMVFPLAPSSDNCGYQPQRNTATFRGGAGAEQIRGAIEPARQIMSQFKFPEPEARPPARPSQPPVLPDLRILRA